MAGPRVPADDLDNARRTSEKAMKHNSRNAFS